MTIAYLVIRIIVFAVGVVLCYYLSPKTRELTQGQKIDANFLLRFTASLPHSAIGSIFILLGLFGILTFCLGIDTGNYTPEEEDDINILNGVIIGICVLSLEKNIVYYLQKIKHWIVFKKQKLSHLD